MQDQEIGIGLDILQLITDALVNLKQCGGIASDDSLWPLAGGCVLIESDAEIYASNELWTPLQNVITNLKRFESVKNALYVLAHSCERKLGALKTDVRPSFLQRGIQTLPDDILSIIFQFAVDGDNVTSTRPPEITLSHVCARFRSLTLNVPSLWARLTSRMTTSAVRHYIERSKAAPISVVISEGVWSERLHRFIELVSPHASRWNAFTFKADLPMGVRTGHLFADNLSKYFENLRLPNLSQFKLQFEDALWTPHARFEKFTFYRTWTMPNLHHIAYSCVPLAFTSGFFSSEAIRTLDFQSYFEKIFDMQVFMDLLVSMPNLCELRLSILALVEDVQPSLSTAGSDRNILPKITYFSLKADSLTVASAIWDRLYMPLLKKLCLSLHRGANNHETRNLSSVQYLDAIPLQQFVSVKELDFTFGSSGEDHLDLHLLFSRFPGLERLNLNVPSVFKSFYLTKEEKMPPLRSFTMQLRPTTELFRLDLVIKELKARGLWDGFEFFEFKSDTILTKREVETLSEGKMIWFE